MTPSGRDRDLMLSPKASQSVRNNSSSKRYMSPMSNTMYRQMFNKYKLHDPLYLNTTPDSVWTLHKSKDETPTTRGLPIHGGKIERLLNSSKNNETLDHLVRDCNEFQEDTKLKR